MLTKTKYVRDLKVKGSITLPFQQFHPTQLKHSLNLTKRWLNSETSCPEKLCSLHPWRQSKPNETEPCAPCCSCPYSEQGWTDCSPEVPAQISHPVLLWFPQLFIAAFEIKPKTSTQNYIVFISKSCAYPPNLLRFRKVPSLVNI